MNGWVVVLIVAAIVVVALIVSAAIRESRERRTERLRQTFGDEYDRVAVDEHGRRDRSGEEALQRRQMRRRHLDIRPLSPVEQQRYMQEWQGIQTGFVDSPDRSVSDAETLVNEVMKARGYPVDSDFENQAELISVDHADLVSNYRQAHRVYERSQHDMADTEELRNSLVYYRSLFNELLAA
jgi:hypothetical protein